MAFPICYTANVCFLFEIIALIISVNASGLPSSRREFSGPFALVRLKRAPQQAFTFSGFNPNNGLTALATSAEFFPPYYNYQTLSSLTPSQYSYPIRGRAELESPSPSSPNTASSDYSPDYETPSKYPSSESSTEDRSFPSPNLTPPSEQAPTTNYNQNSAQPPKKYNKKKSYNKEDDDDADDDDMRSKSKSTSTASFNAWFPILLGMYPSRGNGNSNSYKEDVENASIKSRNSDSYSGRELGTTVIANSVSNGKSSVASSHAIAYGGDPSMKSYRKG